MNLASPTLDKSSYALSEMGYQYFLEFAEVKEKMLPYLENYELLNDLLKSIFEKANLQIEKQIKKIFEEEKENNNIESSASCKVTKIKIIYILSKGHFNILTNIKNRTITIDFFLAFNISEITSKLEIHSICKNLEISLCDFFGWENCFLNLYFKRGGNSNALKLPENKASHANILKNVKLTLRKEIESSEYRIYDSLLLDKIFIKNEHLLFSSKLFDLISSFYFDFIKSENAEAFNFSNDKFIAFTEYFPKLNFLLYNYQNLSKALKSIGKKDKITEVLLIGGDFMFGLLLMLLILREKKLKDSELKSQIKILFMEKDNNEVCLLKANIVNFAEFVDELKNQGLFEIIKNESDFANNKQSKLNKYDLVVNLEEEKNLEQIIKEYYAPLDQAAPFITFVKNSEREKAEELLKTNGFGKYDFTDINEQDDTFDDLIVIAQKL